MNKIKKTNAEWQDQLSPEQYRITRKSGTERPGSHPLNEEKREGTYECVCCGKVLFNAEAKYESGSGWPSFFQPANAEAVGEHADNSLFRKRTEVRCAACDAHLGHVFDDGPNPTGLRYCMNGGALSFTAKK
ncbi:MAG: peptide-methionine (R)-S-oxide reductase MsrB [Devosiaceae bacterium]|nr:peptide-methionine (R)-S-oxide reductase MsrB [Devosiaceae bacterium]